MLRKKKKSAKLPWDVCGSDSKGKGAEDDILCQGKHVHLLVSLLVKKLNDWLGDSNDVFPAVDLVCRFSHKREKWMG
jgi:hypothetical protein